MLSVNLYHGMLTLAAVRGLAGRRQVEQSHLAADSRGSRMNIWGGELNLYAQQTLNYRAKRKEVQKKKEM